MNPHEYGRINKWVYRLSHDVGLSTWILILSLSYGRHACLALVNTCPHLEFCMLMFPVSIVRLRNTFHARSSCLAHFFRDCYFHEDVIRS